MRGQRPQLFGRTLFVDLMMSSLVIVTSLLIVSNALERKKQEQKDVSIETEGRFAITIGWPDDSEDDMDLYVRDPSGNIVYFQNRDTGLMHLEHDDLGSASDTVAAAGGKIAIAKNEERVIIRGIVPGEYLVNVHAFRMNAPHPLSVRVRLYSLKGDDKELMTQEMDFTRMGEEQTAFRFTLNADGATSDFNRLSSKLLRDSSMPAADGREER